MTAETAIRHASATLLSGPAAGAVGGIFFAELLKLGNLITMDMGGTSFDVTLVNEGKVTLSTEGSIAGYRIAKPMCDINTIGAGGGSHRLDRFRRHAEGRTRLGGLGPGPVCYDLGGTKPTVTDANLLLGYLDKDYFLGGEMSGERAKGQGRDATGHWRSAGHVSGGRGGGDLPHHQPEHGGRDQGGLGAARLRSARIRPGERGRRLLHPRVQDRRRGGVHHRHRPQGGKRVLRAWACSNRTSAWTA